MVEESILRDLSKVHPRIAAILWSVNQHGGVKTTTLTYTDAAIPFPQEHFDILVEHPDVLNQMRAALALDGVEETVEYQIQLREEDGVPTALEVHAVRQMEGERPFKILRFPIRHVATAAWAEEG
ncbi:MAG: hypothetical protein U0166_19540 [Acidobacteriota bacterium]